MLLRSLESNIDQWKRKRLHRYYVQPRKPSFGLQGQFVSMCLLHCLFHSESNPLPFLSQQSCPCVSLRLDENDKYATLCAWEFSRKGSSCDKINRRYVLSCGDEWRRCSSHPENDGAEMISWPNFYFFCVCWSNLSGLGQYQAVYLELVWLGGMKILRVLSACGIHLCPMLEDKNHQTQMMVGRHDRNILCPIKSPKTEINESDWNSCLISIICRMP